MANVNTAHSKELRQQTATERRKAIKNDGGKDLSNVLLEKEEVRKLMFLCDWFGSGNKASTQTEVIKKLIESEYQKHAYKPLFEGDLYHETKHEADLTEEEAYSAGYIACSENRLLTDNPYESKRMRCEWVKGWKHYDADYNPDYYSSPLADDL